MIDLIKKKYILGDFISVKTSSGSYIGSLENIESSYILLETKDTIVKIAAKSILEIKKDSSLDVKKTGENNIAAFTRRDISDNGIYIQARKELLPVMGYILSVIDDNVEIQYKNKIIKIKKNKIIDKKLFKEINISNKSLLNIPILIVHKWNDKNMIDCVLGLKSIEQFNSLINSLDSSDRAFSLALFLDSLYIIPNSQKRLKKLKLAVEQGGNALKHKEPQNINLTKRDYYTQANREKLLQHYDEAIDLYNKSIANNEKISLCIRMIADCYCSKGDPDKAREYMLENEEKLPKELTTYNALISFYMRTDIDVPLKVIEFCDIILNNDLCSNRERVRFLSHKGIALLNNQKEDDAIACFEAILKIDPTNAYATFYLEDLTSGNNSIINEEYNFIGRRNSRYLTDLLKNFLDSEYVGIPIDENGNFKINFNVFKSLEEKIERTGLYNYASEKAKYLLTQAKILEIIEPNKTILLNKILSSYCDAMAISHLKKSNVNIDVVRFYLLESIALLENIASEVKRPWLNIRSTLIIYFSLFHKEKSTVFKRNKRLDVFLTQSLFSHNEFWKSMLLVLNNRVVFANLYELFYNSNYKESSINFLSEFVNIEKNCNLDSYKMAWQEAIRIVKQEQDTLVSQFNKIIQENTLNNIYRFFCDTIIPTFDKYSTYLTQTDIVRFKDLQNPLFMELIRSFSQSTSFSEKERNYKDAMIEIERLEKIFCNNPTRFSYENYVILLQKIRLLFQQEFSDLLERSKPIVSLSIIGDHVIDYADRIIDFQILISNKEGSSPIRNFAIELGEDGVDHIDGSGIIYELLNGGDDYILRQKIKVSEKIIKDEATPINAFLNYFTMGDDNDSIKMEYKLSLQLNKEKVNIHNPFKAYAKGHIVDQESMFFGRTQFIKDMADVLISASSKQYIIYGQKRCGKSSVLWHLKQLLNQKNAFCVEFSLEEIAESLNTTGIFYYTIIFKIVEELNELSKKGHEIPNYQYTIDNIYDLMEEYVKTPISSTLFIRDIKSLLKSFEISDNWREKKLILMIDEFTYLYSAIERVEGGISDTIMKQWKAITQTEGLSFSSVFIGTDTVPAFKNKPYARNAFAIISDVRLSYLPIEGAKELIERPIWVGDYEKRKGYSRYINKAVDKILQYTACSPFYIMIFCDFLVDYMNKKQISRVTEADVIAVVNECAEEKLTLGDFDNLLTAGDDSEEVKEQNRILLYAIAKAGKNDDYCGIESIADFPNAQEIVKDLIEREVLEMRDNRFKIKVKLFKEWLLKH